MLKGGIKEKKGDDVKNMKMHCWFLYLFVLVMEAVSRMLDKAVRDGCIFGLSVGISMGNHLQVTLLFADEILIMCDTYLDQILYLRLI